jgi:hypothetical protein
VISTTDSLGNAIVLSDASEGAVITTTDAKGRTIVTTITPGGGEVSALVYQTTVLPDGQRSTITSFALVGGAAAATPSGSQAAPGASSTGTPGLQHGMAAPTGKYAGELAALVGGAIGFAALL